MDHFVTALGLDSSYSLVVLNPTWHVDEPVYGYRLGISSEEMQALRGNNDRLRRVMVGRCSRTTLACVASVPAAVFYTPWVCTWVLHVSYDALIWWSSSPVLCQ